MNKWSQEPIRKKKNNFQTFKKYVLKSQEVIAIKKIIILFIVILPTKFFSLIYVQYIKNFKNKHTNNFSPKLALAQINRILK